MEKRNVQLTGTKSFTLTLPKNWIRFHDIQPKQPLYIKFENDGSLKIHPHPFSGSEEKVAVVSVGEQTEPEQLFRTIINRYLAGKNTFKILGKGKLGPEAVGAIQEFVQRMGQVEITEETLSSVYLEARDIFSQSNLVLIQNSIWTSVKLSLDDLVVFFKTHDRQILAEIQARELGINRDLLEFFRIANLFFSNPSGIEQSLPLVNDLQFIFLNLEQIADRIKAAAANGLLIPKDQFPPDILAAIKGFLAQIQAQFAVGMEICGERNATKANAMIDFGNAFRPQCDAMMQKCVQYPDKAIPLFKIIQNIAFLSKNLQNIGELLLTESYE